MAPPFFRIVLLPHAHSRLALQQLRTHIYHRFGFYSAYALEPCIPLAAAADEPQKKRFLSLAYRSSSDPVPAFSISGVLAAPDGWYAALDNRPAWQALSAFCASRLTAGSAAGSAGEMAGKEEKQSWSQSTHPPLLSPAPGIFLCRREELALEANSLASAGAPGRDTVENDNINRKVQSFIELNLPQIHPLRSFKLAALRIEIDSPEEEQSLMRWALVWQLSLRRGGRDL